MIKKLLLSVNEFGEVGIDNQLVEGAEEENIEMNKSCICCTVRGDLIRILGELMDAKRAGNNRKGEFDRILIETTGLADPAPVAQTFFVDEEIAEFYRLDAIVTVVDAIGFLLLLAIAVSEAIQIVGSLLVFTLMTAPSAAARHMTHSVQ